MSEIDIDAVKKATVARFQHHASAWHRSQERVKQLQAEIAQEQELQGQIGQQLQHCYSAATLFGFDLLAEMVVQNQLTQQPPAAAVPTLPIAKPFSIKDFVLDEGRQACPNPVTAAELRTKLEGMGHAVHEKTVGMTLYRLLKKGFFRREGRRWFYISDAERAVRNETPSEDQSEGVDIESPEAKELLG